MNKKFLVKIIILAILIHSNCFSNELSRKSWLSIGGGKTVKAFSENHSGLSISAIGNRRYDDYLLSIHLITNFEFRYLGYMPTPIESINHIGIVYSKYKRGKDNFISIGVGPSYVNFVKRGKLISDNWPSASEYEKKFHHNIGLLFSGQVLLIANNVIGIGFHPYVNLNTEKIYSGFIFSLEIGNLKH